MDSKLIVLFGNPGTGKTYVGQVIQESLDYKFVDLDFYQHQRKDYMDNINKGLQPTTQMRVSFIKSLKPTIQELIESNSKVAVAHTLVIEPMRVTFLDMFPHAKFILIDVNEELRISRVLQRTGRKIASSYDIRVAKAFEAPKLSHLKFINEGNNKDIVKFFSNI